MSSSESKLVLIDGNAIMHRAFHALPPLTTRKNEPINAVYGFTSMLLRVINDLKPTHLAICFDRKEPTFRKKEFKEYQAHRPETDKDLIPQFPKAREVAGALGVPVYDKKGYEADDLIGTLAQRAVSRAEPRGKRKQSQNNAEVDEVVIVTGDKDIFQLINEKVKVYLPLKGLSVSKMMGEEEVKESLGVTPKQIVDYKALVGDPSDNYKGVKGVGPKTAVELLANYKTLAGVYKNKDRVRDRVRDLLIKYKSDADMSYKLAQIVTDVDFKFDLSDMNNWQIDSGKVLDLFDEFGFRTLKKRIISMGKVIQNEKQGVLF